jgi:hypothetical protein
MRESLGCLSCAQGGSDFLMLQCGHQICPQCLKMHAHEHPKSALFCHMCYLKTPLTSLERSLPLTKLHDLSVRMQETLDELSEQKSKVALHAKEGIGGEQPSSN